MCPSRRTLGLAERREPRVPSFSVVQQAKRHSVSCVALRQAHLLRRAVRPLAAGEPSPLGKREGICLRLHRHARESPARNANAFRSAAALQALPRVNVGQFVGAGAVAPAWSARSRSQWCRFHRSGRVVVASAIHERRQRGLTLPSRGHATAGHIGSLRQGQSRRCMPLMSNVRPRKSSPCRTEREFTSCPFALSSSIGTARGRRSSSARPGKQEQLGRSEYHFSQRRRFRRRRE